MKDLLAELTAFRDARDWAQYHTPRNLAEALSVEAGELLQCFLWDGAFPARGTPREELADVLIFALNLALALGVDPETIIREKMARNALKYPPQIQGSLKDGNSATGEKPESAVDRGVDVSVS